MPLTNLQLKLQRLRRDSRQREQMTIVGYEAVEGGVEFAWAGDEEAPYVKVIGGWNGAINVQGVIAHDSPDDEATNFPIKTGGHATAGIRAAVSADDDIADHSVDLEGRQRVRVSGTTAANVSADVPLDAALGLVVGGAVDHDVVDAGWPIKVGGVGTTGPQAPVSAGGDRTDVSTDLEGRLRARLSGFDAALNPGDVPLDTAFAVTVGGQAAYDAAAAGHPLRGGGRARDEVPAAVAVDDMTDSIHELEGRQLVNMDKLIAGENLVGDYLAIEERPTAVQQDCLERYSTAGAAEIQAAVKTAPGRLYEVHCILEAGINADRYVHILDQAVVAVGGEVPIWRALLPANANAVECAFDIKPNGIYCDTGIVVVLSTTDATTTLAAADAFFHVTFK